MSEMTHEELRSKFDRVSDYLQDWQGVPVLLGEDLPVVVHDRHPLRDFYKELKEEAGEEVGIVFGGPSFDDEDDEVLRNHWYSRVRNAEVYVFQRRGKFFAVTVPRAPDLSMDRLTYWLTTIGASDAWDLEAEYRARELLRSMLSERQWRHYDLTGCFFETSPRSQLTYVFRRLRPTIALSPRHKPGSLDDNMRCIAVLCAHPIGYYQQSWGGCMVPSDDVIAHLTWMRGDEAGYWKIANQHEPWRPEAGL